MRFVTLLFLLQSDKRKINLLYCPSEVPGGVVAGNVNNAKSAKNEYRFIIGEKVRLNSVINIKKTTLTQECI